MYDLIVIGGGPAGSSGALVAAAFGNKVALVEQAGCLGGAGINTGTIPSKTLRESALLLSGWRARKLLGISMARREEARLADFTRHEQYVAATSREQIEARCRDQGVEVIAGQGRFLDPHTIGVRCTDGRELTLRGRVILLATGSSPVHPPEFPFEHPRVHDSNEILEIAAMPHRIVIVGAGVIGAEYACTFAALGVEVHLVDGRDVLLSFLDGEVSTAITRAMQASGVHFHWRDKVVRCVPVQRPEGDDEMRVTLSSGLEILASDVLVAAGRSSNTAGLNLAAAGLEPGKRGLVAVDPFYRTAVPHIYAAGDVVGAPALAATGMEQARVAVCRAFDLVNKRTSPVLPTGIYTIPEASMAGETEEGLRTAGVEYVVGRASYAQNPRGQIIGDETGFLKLLFRRGDMRLVGVHVVGEQATEVVHIGLMALMTDSGAELFSNACFNYPTLGDLYKTATYDAVRSSLAMSPASSQRH